MANSDENPFQGDPNDDIPPFEPPSQLRGAQPMLAAFPSPQARLQQLREREAALEERGRRLRGEQAEVIPSPNFPAWAPMFVFNLDRDIPKRAHSCVSASLYGLAAAAASVLVNLLAVLAVRGLPSFHRVRSLIFGIIQGFGTVYFAFNYSFLKLYAACRRRDVPFSWVVTQFVLVGWIAYLAIGFPDSGCVGVATFLDLLAKSRSTVSMCVAAVNTALIVAVLYFQFVTLYRAQAYQKVSGQDDGV
jgi:hypothetical protein